MNATQETLPMRKHFLEYLFPKKRVLIAIVLFGIIYAVGGALGIFETGRDSNVAWAYWYLFMVIGSIVLFKMMDAYRSFIQRVPELFSENPIRQEDKPMTIKRADKIQKWVTGWIGIVGVLLIALPFMVSDLALGPKGNNWIDDTGITGDNVFNEDYYGSEEAAYIRLAIWMLSWVFLGSYLWILLVYTYTIKHLVKNYSYSYDILDMIRFNKLDDITDVSLKMSLVFVAMIVIRTVYQIVLEPWIADAISLPVLIAVFIVSIILPLQFISKDVEFERKDKTRLSEEIAIPAISETNNLLLNAYQKNQSGSVSQEINSRIFHALLFYSYLQLITKQSVVPPGKMKKIIFSIAAPLGSLLSKQLAAA